MPGSYSSLSIPLFFTMRPSLLSNSKAILLFTLAVTLALAAPVIVDDVKQTGSILASQNTWSGDTAASRTYETADWQCKLTELQPYPLILLPGFSVGPIM